ncbi:MAG: ABC transporter substrate-binding protein [Planctomycetota bacterium]
MTTLRIASLLPSATEMVCALGAEAELVGVSHECDWPASVVGRPVLTSSRIALHGAGGEPITSGEIDKDIRRILEHKAKDALAVYDIDERALADARPDVIVTQDLCDVCAVSFADVQAAARKLTHAQVRIVNLHPTRLADIWTDIGRLGEALGRQAEAQAVLADMDRRVAHVRARADSWLKRRGVTRPAVLTIEWIDPVMVGGTWMPELVEAAGGRPLVTQPGAHAPTLTREQLQALDPAPEVVVVKPCGFPLERTLRESETLARLLAQMPWPAVREGRVWLADGNAFFNRPGPRIVDSLEIMAACVHPEAFADLARHHAGSFRRFASHDELAAS